MTEEIRSSDHVALDWNDFYYTNCPLVSASNVDQELGWVREELKKIGIEYSFLRSRRENNWYPHYIHNMDNLMRAGGCFPAIAVQADVRRTRLIGLTHVPQEGGCMLVRARDDIHRMKDLKGKKIGLSKSLNTIKNDWWRCQEEQGDREHAHAQRHDPRRRRDRRVPVPGRLVRQAGDAGSDVQPV